MIVAEQINDKVHKLPVASQKKVLHYVETLLGKNGTETEEEEWSEFSFAQAMRGLEDDDMPEYTDADLKEQWLPSPTAINIKA